MCTFYVKHPVFQLDMLQHLLCTHLVLICFISFACTSKTFEIQPYAKNFETHSMPRGALKILLNISGNICVSCIKMSSQGDINFKKII